MRTAAYARYSSDLQRQASIEDQLRNVRTYCQRHGWPEPTAYTDAATSGARNDRPGYRQLLTDAEARRFEVLLVDDLSRLSRDELETKRVVRMLRFWGIRLIGVSDGIDTDRKGHKLEVGLRGLMGELYLEDLADKTHRGLMGRALKGFSAGGLPYGYRSVPDTDGSRREIDETQAVWVRHIYERFAAGINPRRIAAELNTQGVPSPRGSSWAISAIYGDRRGIGILANPIYAGEWVWNRSKWIKDPVTGRRLRTERPQAEWVTTHHPELRIVPAELWERVQARLLARRQQADAVQREHGPRARSGAGPKYLFSGLLKCGACGGPLVVVNARQYGCARAKDRGTCHSRLLVTRSVIEERLLAGVKAGLLSEEAWEYLVPEVRRQMRAVAPDLAALRQALAQAERERDNIMAAIRAGILTDTTKAALETAERAVAAARGELEAAQAHRPDAILPRLKDRWRETVARLEGAALRDVGAARQALSELLGDPITISRDEAGVYAELPAQDVKINVVAGVGFEPTTFGL